MPNLGRAGLSLVLVAVLGSVGCGGGGETCTPEASTICIQGVTYWVDSCDVRGEVAESCLCGCAESGLTCRGACPCEPECAGKVCGGDGCGGSCGECTAPAVCQPDGTCACIPACTGRECGDDGCGGSCGECLGGLVCWEEIGMCQGDVPCCAAGQECGPDPCYGVSCGTCDAGEHCDVDNHCVPDCVPDCAGKECGDDACGGQCPSACNQWQTCDAETSLCAWGGCDSHLECRARYDENWYCEPLTLTCRCLPESVCNGVCCAPGLECHPLSGLCEEPCVPDCSGRECGPDPACGTSCGGCLAPETCGGLGLCVCNPGCAGRECGPDPQGCGTSCGTCSVNEVCDAAGQCIPNCSPDCAGRECGDDGCGGSCGICAGAGEVCVLDTGTCLVCTPDCIGRECGPDPVCGSSCGACLASEQCDVSGMCVPVQEAGEPCEFDSVNVGSGECGAGLTCLGMWPDVDSAPCSTTADCAGYFPGSYNPDCVGGGCGFSFCAGECAAGSCEQGFEPIFISGTCFCVPSPPCVPDCGDRVCGLDPVCLEVSCGICGVGEACDQFSGTCFPCTPDCGSQECGPDPVCGTQDCGTCPAGEECDASGMCAPAQEAGEPCEFDGVNMGSGICAVGLACLGMSLDPYDYPCTVDGDCSAYLNPAWNPDCVGGGCGASFCSAPCVGGTCEPGYDPTYVGGADCYCVPASAPGGQQAGEPCAFDGVNADAGNCGARLTCLGIPTDMFDYPCDVDGDCDTYFTPLWNPDCVADRCGVSFCSPQCVGGACDPGYYPEDLSGTCYCIPSP